MTAPSGRLCRRMISARHARSPGAAILSAPRAWLGRLNHFTACTDVGCGVCGPDGRPSLRPETGRGTAQNRGSAGESAVNEGSCWRVLTQRKEKERQRSAVLWTTGGKSPARFLLPTVKVM
ncbi:unnamed protein product [Phaeothamnion confervicola]